MRHKAYYPVLRGTWYPVTQYYWPGTQYPVFRHPLPAPAHRTHDLTLTTAQRSLVCCASRRAQRLCLPCRTVASPRDRQAAAASCMPGAWRHCRQRLCRLSQKRKHAEHNQRIASTFRNACLTWQVTRRDRAHLLIAVVAPPSPPSPPSPRRARCCQDVAKLLAAEPPRDTAKPQRNRSRAVIELS